MVLVVLEVGGVVVVEGLEEKRLLLFSHLFFFLGRCDRRRPALMTMNDFALSL